MRAAVCGRGWRAPFHTFVCRTDNSVAIRAGLDRYFISRMEAKNNFYHVFWSKVTLL